MKKSRRLTGWAVVGLMGAALAVIATIAYAKRPQPPYYGYPPVGIHFQITDDFYRALKEEADENSRKLTTDASEDYLHQIAIATRYTVETNLILLKQQERIIQLLESMGGKLPADKGAAKDQEKP